MLRDDSKAGRGSIVGVHHSSMITLSGIYFGLSILTSHVTFPRGVTQLITEVSTSYKEFLKSQLGTKQSKHWRNSWYFR